MQNRDKPSSPDNEAQQRKTAEFPVLDPEDFDDWASVNTAQVARNLSYRPINLAQLHNIQGFESGVILHIDSGTVVQTTLVDDLELSVSVEPYQSIRRLASQRKFRSLLLTGNDTLYIAGVIPSQVKFLYVLKLREAQANYALTRAALKNIFI